MGRLQQERSSLENDYEQLRGKQEALSHWESQLSEIIQWVSDEKDARSYLQALATKMTEELDYLKHTGMKKYVECFKKEKCTHFNKGIEHAAFICFLARKIIAASLDGLFFIQPHFRYSKTLLIPTR